MGESAATSAPVASGRVPLLGHGIQMLHHPLPFLQRQRDRGEVVKIFLGTRPAYVINSPELIHRVLVADADRFDRGRLFQKASALVGHGLATSDGPFHLRQRRIMQPAFGRLQVRTYATDMNAEVRRLVDSPGNLVRSSMSPRTWVSWRFLSPRPLSSVPRLANKPSRKCIAGCR
nr:cytochrome P450 [Fodinicola feengrottensis]